MLPNRPKVRLSHTPLCPPNLFYSDIHSIPKDLRLVLEQCLGEDPSPAILEIYMPQVRQVLYKLLKGLQARQDAWRAAGGRVPFDTR